MVELLMPERTRLMQEKVEILAHSDLQLKAAELEAIGILTVKLVVLVAEEDQVTQLELVVLAPRDKATPEAMVQYTLAAMLVVVVVVLADQAVTHQIQALLEEVDLD